jgi:hypothetical protein
MKVSLSVLYLLEGFAGFHGPRIVYGVYELFHNRRRRRRLENGNTYVRGADNKYNEGSIPSKIAVNFKDSYEENRALQEDLMNNLESQVNAL